MVLSIQNLQPDQLVLLPLSLHRPPNAQPSYAKGNNWVTGSGDNQLAYRSELAGVIAALTILDVVVRHQKITDGAVTIALDGDSALI